MEEIYQPIVNWVDPDLHVIKITDKSECLDNALTSLPENSSRLPSMAMMIFLQEDGMVGFERIQTVKRYFEKSPWKFHHSEEVHRGAINPYPYNSQDFYYTSEDLPLWAVRQVHTGKEFFRIVLFVSDSNWATMVQFYKLILGFEPDLKREDFCLFTVSVFPNFNIQLALKKLKGDTKPRPLDSVQLQFRVNDISNIMPLLPNVCRPLSDSRWQTTDTDGNVIVLEIPRFYGNSTFMDRCSLSDRSSISGRSSRTSSVSQTRSQQNVNRLCRDGQQRNSVETRKRTSPPTQRTKSLIVDQKLIEKIRNNNVLYKEQAMKVIREQHIKLQDNEQQQQPNEYPSRCTSNSSSSNNDNSSSNNDMSTQQESTQLKSFYVWDRQMYYTMISIGQYKHVLLLSADSLNALF